jgi:hypothetical protein
MIFQEYLGDAARIAAFLATAEARGTPLHYSLEEVKFAAQTLVRRDGQDSVIFCTRQRMHAGRSVDVEPIEDARLRQLGADFARAFRACGWRGPLNVQCQLSAAGHYRAYELNGRLTGATAARYHLGYDEVGAIIEDITGIRVPAGPSQGRHLPLKFHKTGAVRLDDCARLERDGVWETSTEQGQR